MKDHGDEAEQVREVIEQFATALRKKDAGAAGAVFAEDAVNYDLAPPLQIDTAQVRDPAYIQKWFDTWNGPIVSQAHDLTVRTSGDVAFAFSLRHMTGTKTDGTKVDLWFRATACLERRGGAWKVVHMHNSVPFAMDGSDRALLDLKP